MSWHKLNRITKLYSCIQIHKTLFWKMGDNNGIQFGVGGLGGVDRISRDGGLVCAEMDAGQVIIFMLCFQRVLGNISQIIYFWRLIWKFCERWMYLNILKSNWWAILQCMKDSYHHDEIYPLRQVQNSAQYTSDMIFVKSFTPAHLPNLRNLHEINA